MMNEKVKGKDDQNAFVGKHETHQTSPTFSGVRC